MEHGLNKLESPVKSVPFKTIMDAVEQNTQILIDNSFLEFVIFQIPKIELRREDILDLNWMVVKKVDASIEFDFIKYEDVIEVIIRRK